MGLQVYRAWPRTVLLWWLIVVFTGVVPHLQVSLKENGSLSKDSNVTMEIPIHSTIAYALIELEIKHDGRYGETAPKWAV